MLAPVVKALREGYPNMKITVVTRSQFRPFFRDIRKIDFIEFDPAHRHKGIGGVLRLAADIKATGADTLADMHDVLRSQAAGAILRLSGLSVARIDKGRLEKSYLTRKFRKNFVQLKPTIRRYVEVLNRLNLPLKPLIAPKRKACTMPEQIVAHTGAKQGEWIGVAPFAKHKGKIYPIPQMVTLLEMLSNRYERVFLFGGGKYEQDFAECMETSYEGIISVVGKGDLSMEMDLMSNLDVMITMDSSSMHIASLLGVPVISVWGATHPYAGFYGFGQHPDNAVQLDMPCRPCSVYGNKKCMFGDWRCLHRIPPEMIFDKVDQVLNRKQ